MFDIGWTEIILVLIVSALMLDTKDIPTILKAIRQLSRHLSDFVKEIKQFFVELEQEANIVTDLDGNEQISYSLDDIMPDINKEKNDKQPKA